MPGIADMLTCWHDVCHGGLSTRSTLTEGHTMTTDSAGRKITTDDAGRTVRTMPDFSATPVTCAHSAGLVCASCPPRQAGRHRSPVIDCWGYRCGAPLYQVTGQAGGTRYVNVTDHEPHTCARYPLGGDAPAPYAGRHAGQATR